MSYEVLLGSGFSFHKSAGKKLVSGRVFGHTMLQGKEVERPSWVLGWGNTRPDLQNLQVFTSHLRKRSVRTPVSSRASQGRLLLQELGASCSLDRGLSRAWLLLHPD